MKRLFDIVASGLGLIVLSPLFLILAIWIKLDSKGPVFYRQVRVGRHNKDFRIFKFRSMRVGADKGSLVTIGGRDPRVTKSGYWIRKFKLDELPQLINVFIGDMSLVGPRPEMMANVARYKMELPSFVYREKMKAGLTGYAQIEGRYNTTAEDKLMLDMMYIESFSIWLDIKLLLRTFTIFLKKDSTQGFTQAPDKYIDLAEERENA